MCGWHSAATCRLHVTRVDNVASDREKAKQDDSRTDTQLDAHKLEGGHEALKIHIIGGNNHLTQRKPQLVANALDYVRARILVFGARANGYMLRPSKRRSHRKCVDKTWS